MEDRYDWLTGDMPESQDEPKPIGRPRPEPGTQEWEDSQRRPLRPSVRRAQPYDWPAYHAQMRKPAQPVRRSAPLTEDVTQPMQLREAQTVWISEAQDIQAEALTARDKEFNIREREHIASVRFDMTLTAAMSFIMLVVFVLYATLGSGFYAYVVAMIWGVFTGMLIYRTVLAWRHKLPPL